MNEEQKRKLDLLNAKDAVNLEIKYGKGFCYVDPKTKKPIYEKDLIRKELKGVKQAVTLARQLHKIRGAKQ